jgi:hypothetical protein
MRVKSMEYERRQEELYEYKKDKDGSEREGQ